MNTRLLSAIAGGALAFSVSANAGMIVDFTDSSVWNSTGSTSESGSIGGVLVTVTASGGTLDFTDFVDNTGADPCGTLSCDQDGLGIGPNNFDEIDPGETLTIDFSVPVNIMNVSVLDMFFNGAGPGNEGVQAVYDNGSTHVYEPVSGDPTNPPGGNGFIDFDLDVRSYVTSAGTTGNQVATQIVLTALDTNDVAGLPDFALASLEFQIADQPPGEIPVPAALPLLVSGIAGLALFRRRRSAA